MVDVFFETYGVTELTSAVHDWHLSTAENGLQRVTIDDNVQKFRLEVFKESKVSLKSQQALQSSYMISIGRQNKIMANLQLMVKPAGLSVTVNEYDFCDERILHAQPSWHPQELTKSEFIHIELDTDNSRLDVSLNKGKFMTMFFDEQKLIHCTLDGSGFLKSIKIYRDMCEKNDRIYV